MITPLRTVPEAVTRLPNGLFIASIGYSYPAQAADADYVIQQSPTDDNGRSPWLWVRLSNGDLLLACYPRGDTYVRIEDTFE